MAGNQLFQGRLVADNASRVVIDLHAVYLGLTLLSYAVLTHLVKTRCTRRFGLS